MLSDYTSEAEIQIFSVEEAAGVAYIFRHLKDSLYLHTFIFTSMNTHGVAAEISPLGTEWVWLCITSNIICIEKYSGLQFKHLSRTEDTPLSGLHPA